MIGRCCGLRCALAALVVGLCAGQAYAQFSEQQELTASDAGMEDQFGTSVSVSGDTAVVGANFEDCAAGGPDCGSAYVYRFNGTSWVEEQKLTASAPVTGAQFGTSVSVSGDTAIVGAWTDECAVGPGCGAVYVFRFNGSSWVEEQKLTASDAAVGAGFGVSVSMSGGTMVVGAHFDDCASGSGCGSAYVFRFNGSTWVEEQKLTASDADTLDTFGASISVSGDVAVVTAPAQSCPAGELFCGAMYVFRFNGSSWVEEQKVTPSDLAFADMFGRSVSVSGDTAVVGANGDNCALGEENCGSAYVFRFNGTSWVEGQKLTASDAALGDHFGYSVSLSGGTLVVGTPFHECLAGTTVCGAAYVFRLNGSTWGEVQKLTASDAAAIDTFGRSVAVSGHTVLVGAPRADCAAGDDCGAAYLYVEPSPPPPPPIPAVSTWGLIAMTLLLLIAGTIAATRRHLAA